MHNSHSERMAWRRSIHTVRWGVLIVWAMFAYGTPVGAVLVDKLVAVVNGEILTVQDFEDHLALRSIYQPDVNDSDRQQAFQGLVDQVLLRQEALRTRLVQVDDAEVSQHLQALDQPPQRGRALVKVMQERGLSRHDVRAWIRDYLIVRAFIDRRVRLFVRIPDNQIAQYYQDHQQAIGEPLDEAVRKQIGCVLTERQVNRRLTELLAELRKKGQLDFPP
ncbi:MAG TPA: SurA N-terminal domain-containing protein [Candidatus Tectomicrobia bacterium]